MATIKQLFGALVSLTVTSLAALANAAYWNSDAIDNEADLWVDALVSASIVNHATTAPTGEQAVHVYVAAALDDAENFTDGVDGTVGTHTVGNEAHLHYLGSIYFSAAAQTRTGGPWSVAAAFGGRMPSEWCVVLENATGAALGAGTQVVKYRPLHYQTV